MLEKEFNYYIENQDKLVKEYNGKFLVIKDLSVQGSFDTLDVAYNWAKENFELGTFLIQECLPGKDSYTQIFHTRAYF